MKKIVLLILAISLLSPCYGLDAVKINEDGTLTIGSDLHFGHKEPNWAWEKGEVKTSKKGKKAYGYYFKNLETDERFILSVGEYPPTTIEQQLSYESGFIFGTHRNAANFSYLLSEYRVKVTDVPVPGSIEILCKLTKPEEKNGNFVLVVGYIIHGEYSTVIRCIGTNKTSLGIFQKFVTNISDPKI